MIWERADERQNHHAGLDFDARAKSAFNSIPQGGIGLFPVGLDTKRGPFRHGGYMTSSPWIGKQALKEWERILDSASQPFDVFEWGSGGSTLWFGMKRIGAVFSIEHNL